MKKSDFRLYEISFLFFMFAIGIVLIKHQVSYDYCWTCVVYYGSADSFYNFMLQGFVLVRLCLVGSFFFGLVALLDSCFGEIRCFK